MPLPGRPETEARDMTRYIYAIDMHKGLTVILIADLQNGSHVKCIGL